MKASEFKLSSNPENHEQGQLPVEIRIIEEETAALNLLESGKLDVVTTITPTEIPRLKRKGLIFQAPMSATNFLSFNLKKPPFDRLEWRKAIAASIDREGLEKVLNGFVIPTYNFLPSDVLGFSKLTPPAFKKEQESIRKLSDKPAIHIGYAPSGMAQIALEKIQNDLRGQLKVTVLLEPTEQKVYFDSLNKHSAPPVFFLGNASLNGDADLHLKHFVDDPVEGGNSSNYHDEKYEALYKKIHREMDSAKRAKLIQQALQVIQYEDVVVIPIFERRQFFGLNPQLSGFQVNPSGEVEYQRLRRAQ